MGAQRTSNKDIADKLDTLIGLMTAQAEAQVATPKVAEPVVEETKRDVPSTLRVKPEYLARMKVKAQDHATNKGEQVILYGRVNLAGEHKLAYCLASRWATLRDKGLIGAVETFDA